MIYLDSAATTMEKPPAVAHATAWAMTHMASPGRGGHSAGMRAADTLFELRETAADLFDVPSPDRVVLTYNATHALNMAIHALVHPGCTVLISGYEHNAVTRPLCARKDITLRVAKAPVFDRRGMLDAFARELEHGVDVVICTHVSNVFGFILPVEELAGLCRDRGVPLLVDASQSAGSLPVHLGAWGAAYVAMPGHKGLYGPQGTGLLLCGEDQPAPLLYGGTGSESKNQAMPEILPDRLEAGTQNVSGAAGLLAGLRFVRQKGVSRIGAYEHCLCTHMMDALAQLPGVRVFRGGDAQSGVCSITVEGMDCEEVGAWLARRGVAVRAGLHCAPLAHQTAGTLDTGTVRLSFSAFNTLQQVRTAASLVGQMVRCRGR